MIYLLDTNTCILYLTRRNSIIVDKLTSAPRQDVVLCDVVKAELYYGAYRGTRLESNLVLYQEFFREFISLPFDGKAAAVYGRIRAQLESLGTPIGPNDLQIAAIAIANNLILVTHNTREFSRVPDLRFEDWELPL
ncbi:twitching motility protein PilT [Scytonema hofmannii PCC 7110]|uniref:Ribonuclease VapC n=1 Tax=Scytonema hofmannii PCC 7110 TaxID=128403 RepID=A0A139X0B7_9CYAN|nr:type II toxin-antitoxin system VapC family toxin [Scytonema hofmannii]KYC38149.1 twitching motility protein PilT [Scytonema hofmannii PCC 7110]